MVDGVCTNKYSIFFRKKLKPEKIAILYIADCHWWMVGSRVNINNRGVILYNSIQHYISVKSIKYVCKYLYKVLISRQL